MAARTLDSPVVPESVCVRPPLAVFQVALWWGMPSVVLLLLASGLVIDGLLGFDLPDSARLAGAGSVLVAATYRASRIRFCVHSGRIEISNFLTKSTFRGDEISRIVLTRSVAAWDSVITIVPTATASPRRRDKAVATAFIASEHARRVLDALEALGTQQSFPVQVELDGRRFVAV